jgi:hypothetical protein
MFVHVDARAARQTDNGVATDARNFLFHKKAPSINSQQIRTSSELSAVNYHMLYEHALCEAPAVL